MAWILCSFALFMANNTIRTSSTARHTAWKKGNDGGYSVNNNELDASFFMKTNFVRAVLTDGGMATNGAFSGAFVSTILGWAPDIRHAQVPFGVDDMDDPRATVYPFIFMRTQFPFMPTSLLEDWLKMETHCEWEQIDNNWDSITPSLSP